MNRQRRIRIEQAISLLHQAREHLEAIHDEERSAFENLPENLQMSERGQKMEEGAELLDGVICDLEDMACTLEECRGVQ